jgi:hypothetical protein
MNSKGKLRIVLGTLSVIAVGLTNFVVVGKRESFGVVDTQILLARQSDRLAKVYPNGSVPTMVLQAAVDNIKQAIQEYGKQHHVTLLAKGAVLSSNYPDYTESLHELLKMRGLS